MTLTTWIALIVAVALAGYLFGALLKPEWFG